MKDRYFYINDHHLIGKIINDEAFLYINKTWELDKEHILKQRIEGYDFITKTTHNSYIMVKIDEITLEKAEHLMHLV